MKYKMLLIALILISVSTKVCAQYFDEKPVLTGNPDMFKDILNHAPTKEGYTLNLGKGNKLYIPRSGNGVADFTDLALLNNVQSLLDAVQSGLEKLKDSLSDNLSTKKVQYSLIDGKEQMMIMQQPTTGSTYYLSNGNAAVIKQGIDTIIIVKEVHDQKHFRMAALVLSLSNISDFKDIAASQVVENFIAKIKQQMPAGLNKKPSYKTFVTGEYTTGANNTVSGSIKVLPDTKKSLTLSFSADIQNVKNYFVPSASVGLSLNNYYRKFPGQSNNFSITWNPYFFFEKDNAGKLKTYRNDFLFVGYSVLNTSSNTEKKLDLYLPVSIGYLINRSGEFLEKNTFALNAFGVKYGNATIKPYLYFHNLFKGVTPGVQLSIGIGN